MLTKLGWTGGDGFCPVGSATVSVAVSVIRYFAGYELYSINYL